MRLQGVCFCVLLRRSACGFASRELPWHHGIFSGQARATHYALCCAHTESEAKRVSPMHLQGCRTVRRALLFSGCYGEELFRLTSIMRMISSCMLTALICQGGQSVPARGWLLVLGILSAGPLQCHVVLLHKDPSRALTAPSCRPCRMFGGRRRLNEPKQRAVL
jgi:hypothetical protein